MYCLQWFLVFFILPFPSAPSFLVLSAILAMFVQHRPCLYCSAITFGLFLSTCQVYEAAAGFVRSLIEEGSARTELESLGRCFVESRCFASGRLSNTIYA
ncbi:hypothetical protein DFJ74DRAFT_685364 [Hyaloraphidium curvatum]|nr:hypothetical protein DFJ74DRAFT_685364 [Hyaloraphidium curvatum]